MYIVSLSLLVWSALAADVTPSASIDAFDAAGSASLVLPSRVCTKCGDSCFRLGLPVTTGVCNANLQCVVRTVNPPNCLRVGCVCGKRCRMPGGSFGVCQTDGHTCAVNVVAPNCNGGGTVPCGNTRCPASEGCGNPSCSCCGVCSQIFCGQPSCVCGQRCTMSGGATGTCQEDGKTCANNILPPNCHNCLPIPCPAPPPCVWPSVVTTPTVNGCPGCPTCTTPPTPSSSSCSSDSGCTNGFCWQGRCVPWSGVGEGCNGFILPPKRCRPGLQCKMSNIPDVGGTCVKHQICPPCPDLYCPLAEQVTADATVDSTVDAKVDVSVDASLVRPLCPRCPTCLPCCPPISRPGQPRCRNCGFVG